MPKENAALDRQASQGMRVALEAVAAALLNKPDDSIIADVRRVARNLGSERFDGIAATPGLEQRYFDRFFIPVSPYHIPLSESRIANAAEVDGAMCYGPASGSCTDHAEECYRRTGFDFRKLVGLDAAVRSLAADSLASQLSFLAFLEDGAASDAADAPVCERLARQFLEAHDEKWVRKAARIMRKTDDDFYSRLADFTADLLVMESELHRA